MKKCGRLAAAFLAAALFTACGLQEAPGQPQHTTLVIAKDGAVTAYQVGAFDKAYYDPEELEVMAREEAAAFAPAEGGKAPVTVENVETVQEGEESRVIVTYAFDGPDSYEAFCEKWLLGEKLFFGTVAQARQAGYLENQTLYSVADGTVLAPDELEAASARHLIILEGEVWVYCPHRVTHMSRGAFLREDGSVDTSQAEGPAYILLKK